MTSRDFCYWLQGFFELSVSKMDAGSNFVLSPDQIQCIQKHLNMVFAHEIDPSFGNDNDLLNAIHNTQPVKPHNSSDILIRC